MKQKTLKVMVATDLHYISDSINDKGPAFEKVNTGSDGKYMKYGTQIVNAFIEEVIDTKPDVLVLTGDLTFNGERASHNDLINMFETVESHGITVNIIPGNHDIENMYARAYVDDHQEFTSSISKDDFRQMYSPFGYEQALYKDTESFSYISKVNSDTWFLFLDVNATDEVNHVSDTTLQWLNDVLKQAQEHRIHVISFTHQNLLQQSNFKTGFVIEQRDAVTDLYEKFNVQLNLAGHLHFQHQTQEGNLLECDTSSLVVAPIQYGVMEVTDKGVSYHTQSVDMQAYSQRHSLNDPVYDDFITYAQEFFLDSNRNRKLNTGSDEPMMEWYRNIYLAYFSGNLTLIQNDETLLAQWKETDEATCSYLRNVLKQAGNDYRSFTIDFQSE
ncbi:MAG: metallophosphoesterase family protein [Bulleidia sp.]